MRSSTEQVNIRASRESLRTSSSESPKFAYAKSEISSVTPPADLTAPPQAGGGGDTLQDLIARMREAKKNRTRFHLTETDCTRMCTNATELSMAAGQVIVEEGSIISNVYRIKKGLVSLVKGGVKLYDLPAGHFLGEGLFIRGDAQDRFGAALIANGPVIITQLNLPLVRQLLEVDKLLAFKLYRHIATKLSGLVVSVTAYVTGNDTTSPFGSPRGHLSSDVSMIRLDSETMTGVTGNDPEPLPADVPFAVAPETITSSARKARKSARKSARLSKKVDKIGSFKKYPLEGDKAVVKLTDTKITISHDSTLKKKRKIRYKEILSVSKTGSKTVTIIYDVQANEADFHEFVGLVEFLVANNRPSPDPKEFSADVPLYFSADSPFAASPRKKGAPALDPRKARTAPTGSNPLASAPDELQQVAEDKVELLQLAVRQDLVKGDLVIAEGDLYQRIYTVVYGRFYMKRCGRILAVLEEGDMFGVLTLFYMRPSIFSLEVASDNATLLVIPGYKIHELVNTNFALAVRLYKKAAQQIFDQIEKLLTSSEGLAKGLTESHFLL